MANARFVDALVGYNFFLKMRGNAKQNDINQYLKRKGRNLISPRMYTHYRKLLDKGFRSYIPINQFDVFHTLGRLQAAADRRRYSREPSNSPVLISRNITKWTDGVLVDRSIVGFGLNTSKRFPVRKHSPGWIRLPGYKDIPVIFVWRKHTEYSTRIGLRALEFISKYKMPDLVEVQELPSGLLRISRVKDGEIRWSDIYRLVAKTDELIKSAEDLLYTLEMIIGVEVQLSYPILQIMEFGSPDESVIKIDFGIAEILKVLFDNLIHWRTRKRRITAETRNQELQNTNLEIEIMRNAIKLKKEVQEVDIAPVVANEIKNLIPKLFNNTQAPKGLFDEGTPELAILEERILPAAAELSVGDDTDFNIEVIPALSEEEIGKKNKDIN